MLGEEHRGLKKLLGNVLGDYVLVGVSVVDDEHVSCSFRFPDGFVAVVSVISVGSAVSDAVSVIARLSVVLSRCSRGLLFVKDGEVIDLSGVDEYMDYKSMVDSTPVYVVPGKLYDLRSMEVYEGDSVEVIDKLVKRYRSHELVMHYLRSLGYIEAYPLYYLWRSDGTFEERYDTYVFREIGDYAQHAVIIRGDRVYRTIGICGVVVETALGKDDPREAGLEFVKMFNKWFDNVSRQVRGTDLVLHPEILYRGIRELGVSLPEKLRDMVSVGGGTSRKNILFSGDIVYGMYDEVEKILEGEEKETIYPEDIIMVICGEKLSGDKIYEYLKRKEDLSCIEHTDSSIIIDNKVKISDRKKVRLIAEFLKKFGEPDESGIIVTGTWRYVFFKTKTGYTLAVT